METIVGKTHHPDLKKWPGVLEAFKKPIPVKYSIAEEAYTVETKEGPVKCKKGDAIMTGVEGEVWPIPFKKFKKTYDIVSDTKATKKKILVQCSQLTLPVLVKVSWSEDLLKGEIGDYLVQYGKDDYGIVGKSIFKKSYTIVES